MKLKNLSREWLIKRGACPVAIIAFCNQPEKNLIKILESLIAQCYEVYPIQTFPYYGTWARWILCQVLTKASRKRWKKYIYARPLKSLEQKVKYGLKLLKKEPK